MGNELRAIEFTIQTKPVETELKSEYTASDIRKILQHLFPHRRLVLSQFTFFNQIGVARPSGESFRRGRRCYQLEDILPIAAVLALKEEGIPLKNITSVPALLQERRSSIFQAGAGSRLYGFGEVVSLMIPAENTENLALEAFLQNTGDPRLFWSYDVGVLSQQITAIARNEVELRKAA